MIMMLIKTWEVVHIVPDVCIYIYMYIIYVYLVIVTQLLTN